MSSLSLCPLRCLLPCLCFPLRPPMLGRAPSQCVRAPSPRLPPISLTSQHCFPKRMLAFPSRAVSPL